MRRVQTEAMRQLHALAWSDKLKRYGEQPYLTRPEFDDRTANGLTKCVTAWIRLNGGQAERISITGRPIDKRVTYTDVLGHVRQIGNIDWIKPTMTRGTADISATIHGRSVKIEVKIGRDFQRPAQKEYQKQVEKAGGVYFIATGFDMFFHWYNKTFNH